ncbi:MotE family protein [Fictibacillus sp. S7]|uniref:MotE family protein n=1 Tax=Fictibacillus sp. S7 TaxID=2212476 RepID=UPI001012EAF8|nr:MotE family protein [Fictibacillus sp. S7]RXY99270.1 hypothetical protein DMO16_06085 [Fictibacillus sp. S7]
MEGKEKTKKFSWFLFVIVMPALFVVVIMGMILMFLGVDIAGKAKEIGSHLPGLSSLAQQDRNSASVNENTVQSEKTYWEKKVKERDQMIKLLQSDVDKKEKEVQSLKADLTAAQNQPEENTTETDGSVTKDDGHEKQKKITAWYNAMSPKNAAAILSKMDIKDAADIMKELDEEVTSSILAKMDPGKAADLTLKMQSN